MDKATVIKTEPGFAYLIMETTSECRGCANKSVCSSEGGSPLPIKIRNDYNLQDGDLVELEFSANAKLVLAFLLFIFPILSIIAGYGIAYLIKPTEISGIIGASIGLADAVLLLVIYGRKKKKEDNLRPDELKIISRRSK